jgi:hypothetical protein
MVRARIWPELPANTFNSPYGSVFFEDSSLKISDLSLPTSLAPPFRLFGSRQP